MRALRGLGWLVCVQLLLGCSGFAGQDSGEDLDPSVFAAGEPGPEVVPQTAHALEERATKAH
jgi:hypothetical protein